MMKNMNLARWIIVFSVIGSIALGITGYKFREERADLQGALQREVPALARDTQALAQRNTRLLQQLSNEGWAGQTDPASYIRGRAADSHVMLGQVNISSANRDSLTPEIYDMRYTIDSQNRDETFPRLNIANFLYKLEKDSRRLKVTRVHIRPEQKSLKAHEIANDRWFWEADVTSRQKSDG